MYGEDKLKAQAQAACNAKMADSASINRDLPDNTSMDIRRAKNGWIIHISGVRYGSFFNEQFIANDAAFLAAIVTDLANQYS